MGQAILRQRPHRIISDGHAHRVLAPDAKPRPEVIPPRGANRPEGRKPGRTFVNECFEIDIQQCRQCVAYLRSSPPLRPAQDRHRTYSRDCQNPHPSRLAGQSTAPNGTKKSFTTIEDAKISSYLLRVARIKGELKIEMYVTIAVDDARHQASPSAETVPSTQ